MSQLLELLWHEPSANPTLSAQECAQSLGISEITAQILAARPLQGLEAARDYWSPRLDGLSEPDDLLGMTEASR